MCCVQIQCKPPEKLHHNLLEGVLCYINLSHALYRTLNGPPFLFFSLLKFLFWFLFIIFFMRSEFTAHHCQCFRNVKNGNDTGKKKRRKHLLCIYHKPFSNSNYRSQTLIFYFVLCTYIYYDTICIRIYMCVRWSFETFSKFNNKFSLIY